MNNVLTHIEYLTFRHDCVVVKGWGAFIARRLSACYNETTSLYEPPRREISFNPDITHDDGLLTASVARREAISYERARRIVDDELASLAAQLKTDGELSLGCLGRWIYQDGSSPLFEPSERLEKMMRGFNPPLTVDTLAKRVKRDRDTQQVAAIKHPRLRRFGHVAARVAASIIVVAAVGYGLLAPVVGNRDDSMAAVSTTSAHLTHTSQTALMPAVSNASLTLNIAAPGSYRNTGASTVLTDAGFKSSEKDITAETGKVDMSANRAATEVSNHNNTVESVDSKDKSGEVDLRLQSSDKYCLVVASLPTRAGAEQFIRETPGFDYRILEQEGKFRIYVATGQSSAQTLKYKSETVIASRFPDAWVCRL